MIMVCPEQRVIPLTLYNSFKKLSVILTWEVEWQLDSLRYVWVDQRLKRNKLDGLSNLNLIKVV